MLILVRVNAHQLELPWKKVKLLKDPRTDCPYIGPTSIKQLLVDLPVDIEVPQGCLIGRALSEGTGREPHVMAGAQDEDCLDSVGVQLLEAVGRGGP